MRKETQEFEHYTKIPNSILDSDLMKRDPKAFILAMELYRKANNKTGELTAGRFQLAEKTGLKTGTIHSILKRLEKKAKILTQEANNKYTKITLLKYIDKSLVLGLANNKTNNNVTTTQQQRNTNILLITNNDNSLSAKPTELEGDFSWKEWVGGLVADGKEKGRKEFLIMAHYWAHKGMEMDTKAKAEAELRRELRPAGELTAWSGKEVEAVFKWLDDSGVSWGLEAVVRNIGQYHDYRGQDNGASWNIPSL